MNNDDGRKLVAEILSEGTSQHINYLHQEAQRRGWWVRRADFISQILLMRSRNEVEVDHNNMVTIGEDLDRT